MPTNEQSPNSTSHGHYLVIKHVIVQCQFESLGMCAYMCVFG